MDAGVRGYDVALIRGIAVAFVGADLVPPAWERMIVPAAVSQVLRPCSQKPSNVPAAT